jgi:hypothetical protein
MKYNMIDKVLSAIKDYHLPALLVMFGAGTVLAWFHHMDAAFVSYAAVIVGGITGHAFSPAQQDKQPEKDISDAPTERPRQ